MRLLFLSLVLATLAGCSSSVVYRGHMDFNSGNKSKGEEAYFLVNHRIPWSMASKDMQRALIAAGSQRRDGTELEALVTLDENGNVVSVELQPWEVPPPPDRTVKPKK